MKPARFYRCTVLLATVALAAGWASGQDDAAGANTPAETADAAAPESVEPARWQRVMRQLRSRGFGASDIGACAAPLRSAAAAGLAVEPLLLRLEEGAAKGVDAATLCASLDRRRQYLQSADGILRQGGYPGGGRGPGALLNSLMLALESGLSEATLGTVLARARGGQAERMRSIIDAGEEMRLSGIDEETVRDMMLDFADRNLRRMEILRACRFAVQQHGDQVEGARIRQRLWGGNGGGGRWGHGADGTSGRGEPGAGPGAGPSFSPADRDAPGPGGPGPGQPADGPHAGNGSPGGNPNKGGP